MASDTQPDSVVVISEGRIIDVGRKSDMVEKYPTAEKIELPDCLVMPSLVNAHSHISLSDAFGKVSGKTFIEWLANLIELRKDRSSDDNVKASRDGLNQQIRMGITTIGDSNPDLIPLEVALRNKFRGVFYFEVFGITAPIQSVKIREYKEQLEEGLKLQNDLTRLGISPHTPFTVTPSVMRFASGFASKHNLPLSLHIAESEFEIEFMKSKDSDARRIMFPFSRRIPVVDGSLMSYLDSHKLLGQKTACAHGVYLSDDDFKLLAKRKGTLVSCPSSNRNVGSDFLDISRPFNEGVNVCIGTDSPASSDGYDLFHELRLALRYESEKPLAISAKDALRMITVNPAKALGFENEVGTIERGKSADLIAIKPSGNFNFNADDICEEILRNVKGEDVAMTMSSGDVRYSSLDSFPVENPI
jgi:cytosine/adenosine deaminase-related metal-dependent hydrolase